MCSLFGFASLFCQLGGSILHFPVNRTHLVPFCISAAKYKSSIEAKDKEKIFNDLTTKSAVDEINKYVKEFRGFGSSEKMAETELKTTPATESVKDEEFKKMREDMKKMCEDMKKMRDELKKMREESKRRDEEVKELKCSSKSMDLRIWIAGGKF